MNGPDASGTTASSTASNAATEDMNGAFGGIAPFDPSQTQFNGAPAVYWPPSASSSAPQNVGILPAEHPSTSSALPSQICGAPINTGFPPIFSENDSIFSQQQQQQHNFDSHQQQMMRQQNIMRLQQQQFMAANSGADGTDAQAFQQLQQQQNLMYIQQQQQQQQLHHLQQQHGNMHSPMFSPQSTQQPQENGLNSTNFNHNSNNTGGGVEFTQPANGGVTPNFASPSGTPATRMNASPQKNGWPSGMTPQQFQMQQQQMIIEQQRRMMNGNAPQMMIGTAAAPMMMMNGAVRPRPPFSNAMLFTSDMANMAVRDVKENKKFDNMAAWHFANCPPSTSAAAMMGGMPPHGMMPPSTIPSFPPITSGGMYPGMMPAAGMARSPMDGPSADFSAFSSNGLPNGSASPATTVSATQNQSTRGTKRKASIQANSTPSPSLAHPMGGSIDGSAYGDAASRGTPADGRNSLGAGVTTSGGFLSPKSENSSDMGPNDPLKRIEMMTKQHIEEPSAKMVRSDNSTNGALAGGVKSSTTPTASGGSMPTASREQKLAQLTEIRQKLKLDDNSADGGFAMPGAMTAGHIGMMPNFKPGQLTAEQQQQMLTMQMRQQQAFMAAQQQHMSGGMPMPHSGGMMPPTFGGPGMPPTMMPGSMGIDSIPPPNPQMMMMNGNNIDSTGGMNNGQIATQRMLLQQRQYQMQQHEQQQRLMGQAMSSAPTGVATNTPTSATSMNGDAFGGTGNMDPMQANGLLGMWGPPGQHSMPQSLTNLDARVPVQKMQYYAQTTGGDAQATPTQ